MKDGMMILFPGGPKPQSGSLALYTHDQIETFHGVPEQIKKKFMILGDDLSGYSLNCCKKDGGYDVQKSVIGTCVARKDRQLTYHSRCFVFSLFNPSPTLKSQSKEKCLVRHV